MRFSSFSTPSSLRDSSDAISDIAKPPPLHFKFKWKNPTLYIIYLLFCNLALPCIIFYPILDNTNLGLQDAIGISSAALGVSSCFDAPFRLWKLIKHRDRYGPLVDGKWWHFDFSMWFYTICLLVFAVPISIGPAVPVYDLFLMTTAMLVGSAAVLLFISLFPISFLPFPLSSDPARTRIKPFAYYILEDIIAVDFGYGKGWRTALALRYNASPPFQAMIWRQTAFWTVMGAVYFGISAAVVWTTSINFAFAFTLGLFFVWFAAAALIDYSIVIWELKRESKWWHESKSVGLGEASLEVGREEAVMRSV